MYAIIKTKANQSKLKHKNPHQNGNPTEQKIMGTKHLAQVSAMQ